MIRIKNIPDIILRIWYMAPTMDDPNDPFETDWQTLLKKHPVMHMTRSDKGEYL